MHTFAYMLSKPPLFPPYHFPLLFFPFLHSLTCPYLLCLSSGQRPPSAKTKRKWRKRSRRGSNKGAWAGRAGQNRLIWDDTSHVQTQGPLFGAFAAETPVISLMSVWPSFILAPPFISPPPLFLPPCLPASADRRFPPTAGPMAPGGLGWIFPDRLSVPMSSGLRVVACACWQNMNPGVARRQSRTGRFGKRGKKVRTHLGHMMKPWDSARDFSQAEI